MTTAAGVFEWFEKKIGLLTAAGLIVTALLALHTEKEQNAREEESEKAERERQEETDTQRLIHDQYELCRALDMERVSHPEISHMLALPAADPATADPWTNYRLFRDQVRRLFRVHDAGIDVNAELYLKEHAVALHVFDIYEQTYFQQAAAVEAKDLSREKVLRSLMRYYDHSLLRNPRLRFHWDHGGSDLMEPETRAHYDKEVRPLSAGDFVDPSLPTEATEAMASH